MASNIYVKSAKELQDFLKDKQCKNNINTYTLFKNSIYKANLYKVFVKKIEKNVFSIFTECIADNGSVCEECLKKVKYGAGICLYNYGNFNRFLNPHKCFLGLQGEEEIDAEEEEENIYDEHQGKEPDEEDGNQDRKKRKRSENMKKIATECIIEHTRSIFKKLEYIEKELKKLQSSKRSRVLSTIEATGGIRGVCSVCKEKKNLNSKSTKELPDLKPGWLFLNIHARPNARNTTSELFKSNYCNISKMCPACRKKNPNKYLIDTNNRLRMCIICRSKNRKSGTLHCLDCDCNLLQSSHATYKKPMHEAFMVLQETVLEIKKVKTSYGEDTSGANNGEMNLGDIGSIDFVVTINTKNNEKHLYVIEIMNSKKEEIVNYGKKFWEAYNRIKPTKAYMIAFDILNNNGGHSLPMKINILRQWVLFTIFYSKSLPSITNWWFFCERRSAYNNTNMYATTYYTDPIKINNPPKTLNGIDWEFLTDVYMVDEMKSVQHINVNELLFRNTFEIENGKGTYALYNIDKENDIKSQIIIEN